MVPEVIMAAARLHRRTFLTSIGSTVLSAALGAREVACDIAIIGGGVGGCAAALAACRNGHSVILTEETGWVGGQLTSQAVPPDEHPWIESFGCTQTYRNYRSAVRDYYRRNYPLTEAARARPDLNPGNGSVSRLTHEPRVSLAVLRDMVAPHVSSGALTVLLHHKPEAADVEHDAVRSVTLRDRNSGNVRAIHARYFLDATEQGDLLPLTRTEYVTGAEPRKQTGEPHAPENADARNVQAFTYCFAMDYLPGEDHTIERPSEYAFWRDYVPQLKPAWPGRLLSWTYSEPRTLRPRTFPCDPDSASGLWVYRRILDRRNFSGPGFRSDLCLVNWPQNDYWLGTLIDVADAEAERHKNRARQLSLSLLYWMQTEAPRPDGKQGWAGLRLRPDVVGSADGLAQHPYIRESRRIRAEFTVLEQHVANAAPVFGDSVGVGSYRIDLHPSTGGDNYIDIGSAPFQIPLGALICRRMENLIPAAKNIGVTHITNGCYRLHPVEWNIGEAAGLLASECLRKGNSARQIRNTPRLLAEFQQRIQAQGIETAWPTAMPKVG